MTQSPILVGTVVRRSDTALKHLAQPLRMQQPQLAILRNAHSHKHYTRTIVGG